MSGHGLPTHPRAHWICTLGVDQPPGTLSVWVPLTAAKTADAVAELMGSIASAALVAGISERLLVLPVGAGVPPLRAHDPSFRVCWMEATKAQRQQAIVEDLDVMCIGRDRFALVNVDDPGGGWSAYVMGSGSADVTSRLLIIMARLSWAGRLHPRHGAEGGLQATMFVFANDLSQIPEA